MYSGGRLSERVVRGGSADAAPILTLGLDPRGRGAVLRSPSVSASARLLSYVDLEVGRSLAVRVPGSASLGYSGRGDVLWWVDPCDSELAVLPLARSFQHALGGDDGDEVTPLSLTPADEVSAGGCRERVGIVSASDAPVLFTVTLGSGFAEPEIDPAGVVAAYRLPDLEGEETALRELGRGEAVWEPERALAWAPVLRCDGPARHCRLGLVDPDGEGLSVPVADDEVCAMQRWSWRVDDDGDGDGGPGPAVCTLNSTVAGDIFSMSPLAAISPRHYVLAPADRGSIVRYDWTNGELQSAPLERYASPFRFKRTQDGRAVVALTPSGPMVRVGDEGIEFISIESDACENPQDPVISPSGRWAAWTCVSYTLTLTGVLASATVVRVSGAGMERFDGVPMWVTAIDDDGVILMWSRPSDGFFDVDGLPVVAPRNLYTLTPDDVLNRVDALEPEPELTVELDGQSSHWIAARAL